MKKTLLYFVLAMATGLVLVIVPLITAAQLAPENHFTSVYDLPGQMRSFEGKAVHGSTTSENSISDLELLSVSFVVALGVYLLIRRKKPRQSYRIMGQFPYRF